MYESLIDKRYKTAATLVSEEGDWSGLGSDLKKDRGVWIRIVSSSDSSQVMRAWRESTELTRRLGPSYALPSEPRRSASGSLYQVAEIPQRRWSSLAYLIERRDLGWDGASVLVEQIASEIQSAEQAGLQPQGRLEDQILIDRAGDLLICGHWEKAVRNDWAGPALYKILESATNCEGHAAARDLKSRNIVGRLRSARTVAEVLRSGPIDVQLARRQISGFLDEPPKKRTRWPWLLLPFCLAAIALAVSFVPLPATYLPDVTGAEVAEAKKEIESGGWEAKVSQVPSEYQAGQVISQWPLAGKKLQKGKAVKLKVAAPKLDAEVPDLTGLDPETARDILAASGLNMKEYMVQNGPSNQIQSSQPAQGQKLRSGQTVTVTVAP